MVSGVKGGGGAGRGSKVRRNLGAFPFGGIRREKGAYTMINIFLLGFL